MANNLPAHLVNPLLVDSLVSPVRGSIVPLSDVAIMTEDGEILARVFGQVRGLDERYSA